MLPMLKPLVVAISSASLIFVTGCSTLTGIPSHGGGKRFAEEQRLVSASIRSTLKNIDVSPLKGKKVAIVYDLISDEGGGNISGGRLGILAGLTTGYAVSPVTSSTGQFQIFNLAQTGSNYSNTATGVNSVSASTTNIVQNVNSSGTQSSMSNTVTNSNTNNTNETDSTGTQNSTNNQTSTGSQNSTTNIGATSTTFNGSNNNTNVTDGYTTSTNNGSSTNTSTTNPLVTTNSIGGYTTTINNDGSTVTTTNPAVTTTTQTGNVVTTQNTGANTSSQVISPSTNTHVTTPQVNTTTTPQVTTTVKNSGYKTTNTIPTVTNTTNGTNTSTTDTGASVNTNESTNSNKSNSKTTSNSTNKATTTGTSATNQNSDTTASNNSTNASNTTGKNSTNGTENTNSDSETNGNETITRETLSSSPVNTKSQSKGHEKQASLTLQYKGLGNYENLAVPKSDASLLMGLVRNYLILNGAMPTTPTDPQAEVILYVTVDVFGIIRSRFDAYVVNRESVIAETAMEMMAFDRGGNMIMSPRNANHEAKYDENYLLWTGPYLSSEIVRKGRGLLVDFSDVDGSKSTYPSNTEKHTNKSNAF